VKPAAVELRALRKVYGDCVANDDVTLSVLAGSIHAIVGENGAGKSTAMKTLYGMVQPTSGEIRVSGERREWRTHSVAIAAGIGIFHEHFMLSGP
jgi:general nucleoside transport system ATP-binding protein